MQNYSLVNANGELIGINTAIIGPSGGNLGVGFAVPANMARQVMEQIPQNGRVTRGWQGISIQPVTEKEEKAFGLKEARGVLIGDVTPGGPAAKGGVEVGDIVLSVNNEEVDAPRNLQLEVGMAKPGAKVTMSVFRDGSERDLTVTLGEMPVEPAERASVPAGSGPRALEGVALNELDAQTLRELGLPPQTRGVVVADLSPDSPAAHGWTPAG